MIWAPEIADAVRVARRVVILTGAGVSAESGVPTFRDAQTGLWARYRPEDLATPEAFSAHPERVARWYDSRRLMVARVQPNAAHRALATWEDHLQTEGGVLDLFTQNVDRLHQRAGSRRVRELHGTLMLWRCMRCGEEREEPGGPFEVFPPVCACGGLRRPGVVWFGESLPDGVMEAAWSAIAEADLFMSIGTSSQVFPAAGLVDAARQEGVPALELNLEPTPKSADFTWNQFGKAGEWLPLLISAAFPNPS